MPAGLCAGDDALGMVSLVLTNTLLLLLLLPCYLLA
jgi:hypothetical protein